ncbi:MAG: hypothetical protein RRA32_10590, partial [bacterium]|nr:hypothetical protein [bacterium]
KERENDAFPFPWSEKSRIGLFATLSMFNGTTTTVTALVRRSRSGGVSEGGRPEGPCQSRAFASGS